MTARNGQYELDHFLTADGFDPSLKIFNQCSDNSETCVVGTCWDKV